MDPKLPTPVYIVLRAPKSPPTVSSGKSSNRYDCITGGKDQVPSAYTIIPKITKAGDSKRRSMVRPIAPMKSAAIVKYILENLSPINPPIRVEGTPTINNVANPILVRVVEKPRSISKKVGRKEENA